MNRSIQLFSQGQSIWYDNIQRKLLLSGEMGQWIKDGKIYGVTSNPTIFNNAISKSNDYDAAIQTMTWSGLSSTQILDQLSREDIQMAADLFAKLYTKTNGLDGYVSIEVNPLFARDSERTIEEAKRLWNMVDRPNIMVKIPATKEGLPAITAALADGINVNVTLIFSLQRYEEVIDAFLSGLEIRVEKGFAIDKLASVASFFVSRVDTKVDQYLTDLIQNNNQVEECSALLGKAAIANARLAYQIYLAHRKSRRFGALEKKGARFQRPLWASTSTKNPNYRDVIYVEELIGAYTVNTVPPQTLLALLDHAEIQDRISRNIRSAKQIPERLMRIGISMEKVTRELEEEGVKSFSDAYNTCLESIEKRKVEFLKQSGVLNLETQARVNLLRDERFIERMYEQDPSLWSDDPFEQIEIKKRLGWLFLPQTSRQWIPEIYKFRDQILTEGYKSIVLLGMGGSSLAPELYSQVFRSQNQLQLLIVDLTDPDQVRKITHKIKPETTLFLVASKSGGTVEVNAFLDYFWKWTKKKCGVNTGSHFVAITDPSTSMEKTALARNFRRIFLADPTVGGRYSALSIFGLLPAGLIGIDLEKIIDQAEKMHLLCKPSVPAEANPGLVLGALLGQAGLGRKDKLTILCDPGDESFADWLEQLIAESSGKQGRGIVPIVREKPLANQYYGEDRVFVYLRRTGKYDTFIARLQKYNFPALVYTISDVYNFAGEFYKWEVAIAVASSVIRVNAFDQPDVQDNKTRTVQKMEGYALSGKFDEPKPDWVTEKIQAFTSGNIHLTGATTIKEVMNRFIASAQKNDYFAINAYLPYDPAVSKAIGLLRIYLQKNTRLATTRGFGPRFLHSTGQIHKGGANTGLFIQITAKPTKDLATGETTFGVLERAQALGDFESLQARNRRILRLDIQKNEFLSVVEQITKG